ncbi:type IV pilus modification PilV family protein [Robertmurraya sp. FSL R5-0851]|uniref:type IV pilus modification PilV family protein n=1 Tax=Robertmurraya sp. FSL R5-0851 TaxID=2921584 RepID=UPI0030FB29C1
MNNEKGVTLIELLISVVIAGMVIVPLLLIMTGSFTRTVEQGEDTQLNYYGQQIMEIIREKGYISGTSPTQYYCQKDQGCGTATIANYDAKVTITVNPVTYSAIEFFEVTAKIVSTDSSSLELVTVVKKQ